MMNTRRRSPPLLIARISSYNLLFIAIYCHRNLLSFPLLCSGAGLIFMIMIISAVTLGARSVNRHMTSGCTNRQTATIKSVKKKNCEKKSYSEIIQSNLIINDSDMRVDYIHQRILKT